MKAVIFPGQGAQNIGMGKELFEHYADYVEKADQILGYSIVDLCLGQNDLDLNNTRYTQPALFFVNALSYLKEYGQGNKPPDFVAGHSLGEYNALWASGALSFDSGLKLIKARGELMSEAPEGAMLAIIDTDLNEIQKILNNNFKTVDVANHNSPSQLILSGLLSDVDALKINLDHLQIKNIRLNVKGAFHSRYMRPAAKKYNRILSAVNFLPCEIPVISNVYAKEYEINDMATCLTNQLTKPVKWAETIEFLMDKGVKNFIEVGPSKVLTNLLSSIKNGYKHNKNTSSENLVLSQGVSDKVRTIKAENLGSLGFKKEYNVRLAYVSGAMYKNIASKEMIIKMAEAGLMSFLGVGGINLTDVESDIRFIKKKLSSGQSFGINVLSNFNDPDREFDLVDIILEHDVKFIEASGYIQISPALVKYRAKSLFKNKNGNVFSQNKLMAKVSDPRVAQAFMSPPEKQVLEKLIAENHISAEEAVLCENFSMADDVCVEADSGGHTDMGVTAVLLPYIIMLRDNLCKKHKYTSQIRVGSAGGIGSPEAAASAFILGADFVLTGSINQCTEEAGTSKEVKDILQGLNVQDLAYAPAGDMFELGAKVQVVKRGSFFSARASKLYQLWKNHNDWYEIDGNIRKQLEKSYFGQTFEQVYEETKSYYLQNRPTEIDKAEIVSKHKMALVFRWYFVKTMRLSLLGDEDDKLNYQIHCGPAMGAFNQLAKAIGLNNWQDRHVDDLAQIIMDGAADVLNQRFQKLLSNG